MKIVKNVNLGLAALHKRLLARLCEKLGMDSSNVIRHAIVKLAEAEGITDGSRRPSPERRGAGSPKPPE